MTLSLTRLRFVISEVLKSLLKAKQTYHTSALGSTGRPNSYLVQQSILPQLIFGRLAVSLQSFSLDSHCFRERMPLTNLLR
nr:hypothetical protein Iba_chr06cCG15710 [Ipomoea batatas]